MTLAPFELYFPQLQHHWVHVFWGQRTFFDLGNQTVVILKTHTEFLNILFSQLKFFEEIYNCFRFRNHFIFSKNIYDSVQVPVFFKTKINILLNNILVVVEWQQHNHINKYIDWIFFKIYFEIFFFLYILQLKLVFTSLEIDWGFEKLKYKHNG